MAGKAANAEAPPRVPFLLPGASMTQIPVTVLGATGVVGQRFVRRLAQHPLFELAHLAASERSRGKRYAEACAWRLGGEPYAGLADRTLEPCHPDQAFAPIVF